MKTSAAEPILHVARFIVQSRYVEHLLEIVVGITIWSVYWKLASDRFSKQPAGTLARLCMDPQQASGCGFAVTSESRV
jgi:hypothetical protein